MGRVDTVPLFDARARVLADLQARVDAKSAELQAPLEPEEDAQS